MLLQIDDFKRTEKVLIAISLDIPIVKKAILDLKSLEEIKNDFNSYLWLMDA